MISRFLAKVYDHAKHTYRFGFRMLTLGWSDGSTFLPVNGILLSTENEKNRINEASSVDKRTIGYKRRKLSMEKWTSAMLTLLEAARKAVIPAKYVLFDSWFSSPSTLHAVKEIGYDVIGMVKKTPKMFFRWDVWYHMDTGISNDASNVQDNAYGKYWVVRWENQRIGGCIYKCTSNNVENSTASCIKLNIDNRIIARYWIFKVYS